MIFDFKKAEIFTAVEVSNYLPIKFLRLSRILFLIFGFIFLLLYALSFFGNDSILILGLSRLTLGGSMLLFLSFGLAIVFFEIYFHSHLQNPPVKDPENLAEILDFNSAGTVAAAAKMSSAINEPAVSTNALLLALLDNHLLSTVFLRLGIISADLKQQIQTTLGMNNFSLRSLLPLRTITLSDELISLLTGANNTRIQQGIDKIFVTDLLTSLFDYNEIFKQIIIQKQLDKSDLENLDYWYKQSFLFAEKRKRFWDLDNILRKTPIGTSWVYGYPWILKNFTLDITARHAGAMINRTIIGRGKAIEQIEEILSRAGENNVLLVGEAGIGKKTIIEEFARMIANGKALPQLNYKRVLELNIPLITASSKDPSDVQNTLISVFDEALSVGNIVFDIHNFHDFIGSAEGLGRSDISALLIPYLQSSRIQIIATTDPASFHKFIESRADLMKGFEKIEVTEPSVKEIIEIVESVIPEIEYQHKVLFLYSAIKKIVENADRFIKLVPFPEKALDLLSEALAYAKSKQLTVITGQEIDEVITRKTNIPLGYIGADERSKLSNLEAEMNEDIIGQTEATRVIAQAMQRLRVGLTRRNKPSGVFLLVGPTGVGKTQTAKALAKNYFGSESKMVRFDMSEYQDIESIDRFLGSLRSNEPGQLVSLARDNPFSLILLDEIEKAHKNILNIFLQVFDEGNLTDVFGRKVSFEENIIIATSNAGADYIRDLVKEGIDPSLQKEKVIDILVKEKYFSPEFLNRFDEIVIFHPLTQDDLVQISQLLIEALVERLRQKGYLFQPSAEIVTYIAKIGYDPQFGARPMQRAIQDKIESLIARKILEQEITKGVEFTINPQELQS